MVFVCLPERDKDARDDWKVERDAVGLTRKSTQAGIIVFSWGPVKLESGPRAIAGAAMLGLLGWGVEDRQVEIKNVGYSSEGDLNIGITSAEAYLRPRNQSRRRQWRIDHGTKFVF